MCAHRSKNVMYKSTATRHHASIFLLCVIDENIDAGAQLYWHDKFQVASSSYCRKLSREEQLSLGREMPRSLMEAAFLLDGDMFAPDDMVESVKMLGKALTEEDFTMLEQEIKNKYFA